MAKLISNQRITTMDWSQDVRHIELDLGESAISYESGDAVNILPSNLRKDAEEFIHYLGYDPNAVIVDLIPNDAGKLSITRKEISTKFQLNFTVFWWHVDTPPLDIQLPITVLELVEHYLDIMSPPKRYFFELCYFFATAEHEKEKFQEFSSPAGQEDLRSYCHKPRRTVLEVLKDFPSVKLPFEYIFDLIPLIQARSFSIASSMKVWFSSKFPNFLQAHPNQIQITVAIVKYKTLLKEHRRGLCSTWLSTLDPRKGNVHFIRN